ncbi:MAG: leucine--tRNA ligase [Candidatus Parcubacteria bacterium]|nr:leucine--tRNA ligase [Candidatus Parcubacteria bacterium]
MNEYNPSEIEPKWQKYWEEQELNKAEDFSKKPKFYCLIEFPYPSGEGLHVGHPRPYTALDILARKRRMQGFNVMYPIGWDAFGLPTENYAIKTGKHPKIITEKNIATIKRQMKMIGLSFDWSREINTTDPKYYKWTQWIFLQLFHKNLAYKAKMDVNWCTKCNVGLANEEVVQNLCERCGGEVYRREREQWMLKITDYADRLLADLGTVDYLEKIKKQQSDWIGKSYGAQVVFKVKSKTMLPKEHMYDLPVYTTRPDTLFGCTYMVVAPEHELIEKFKDQIDNINDVLDYRDQAKHKTELERTNLEKAKTGIELHGLKAINPVNDEEIPIFSADYVLATYGTGAVMAVPAHDQRDYEFAKKFDLLVKEVVAGGNIKKESWIGDGTLVNSEFLNGLNVQPATDKIIEWLENKGFGFQTVNYHLRDWIFSRQRYWGEPIPIIICPRCGYVPVEEKNLPVLLPEVENYQTTENGDSPLALIEDWVNVECPKCGEEAKRETDTMPQWAGSSWYFLRYCDPKNDKILADKKKLKYWTPVDWYNGGMEHTTLHLLYSRFWHKFLYDIGVVPTAEPYAKRTSHGLILGEDGEKMSKSRGNVVNPDDVVKEYGADTFRVYEMFMGPFDQPTPWSTQGVVGIKRFMDKVWAIGNKLDNKKRTNNDEEIRLLHKTIKQLAEQIETLDLNTCVSALMILINKFQDKGCNQEIFEQFLKILSPFAPHLGEELWQKLGHKKSIFLEKWPEYDPELAKDAVKEVPVQINGKMRCKILVTEDMSEEEIKNLALADEHVKKWLEGKEVKKIIYVPGKILNIVI